MTNKPKTLEEICQDRYSLIAWPENNEECKDFKPHRAIPFNLRNIDQVYLLREKEGGHFIPIESILLTGSAVVNVYVPEYFLPEDFFDLHMGRELYIFYKES